MHVRTCNSYGTAVEATVPFQILVTPYHFCDNTGHFLYFLPGSETHRAVTGTLAQDWKVGVSHKQNRLPAISTARVLVRLWEGLESTSVHG